MTRLAIGQVALRLHLFSTVSEELHDALTPPWPRWMERLYQTEAMGDEHIDPENRQTSMGAALGAVGTRLQHRLKLAAWGVGAMEELGWQPRVDGETIIMCRLLSPAAALAELEVNGILGPMTRICELDESTGFPRVFERHVP